MSNAVGPFRWDHEHCEGTMEDLGPTSHDWAYAIAEHRPLGATRYSRRLTPAEYAKNVLRWENDNT